MTMLAQCQRRAVDFVAAYALARQEAARARLLEIWTMSNLPLSALDDVITKIGDHARVALHFHPDRPDARGRTVADALVADGVYRSQFETLLSNGSLTAVRGGSRDLWEERLFGGAYQADDVLPAQRPKYGALDLLRAPDGPAPRFGSCFFLLMPAVTKRATFTHLDSNAGPVERGTAEAFTDVLAALFFESFERDFAIGAHLRPGALLARLMELNDPSRDPWRRAPSRNLNHYVEAQVHGDVRLDRDVEKLVVDPSFRGTTTGRTLEELCFQNHIELAWHAGFSLAVADVPSDFRGARMPSLGSRLAVDGIIDAAAIGAAAMALRADPAAWGDRGSTAEVVQELKLLWHVVVRFGRSPSRCAP